MENWVLLTYHRWQKLLAHWPFQPPITGWEMTNREGLQGKQDKGRTESELHKENPQVTYYFPVHEKTKENKLRKSLELEK